MKSKLHSNEVSAINDLKSIINLEEVTHRGTYYTLRQLGGELPYKLVANIDKELASGIKRGYIFNIYIKESKKRQTESDYYLTAVPEYPGKSGKIYFYADNSGVIRFNNYHPANSNDSPISD